MLFAPCLMLERAHEFTERRSRIAQRHRSPLPCATSSPGAGEASTIRSMPGSTRSIKGSLMPEVIFTGPAGRLEGRYHPAKQKNAPIAMVLHPHPQFRGTMNHPIVYQVLLRLCGARLFRAALQFPRRRPQPGLVRSRHRRISDAASALDWAQTINPEARACWVAGFSFGAWIGMQLLMRRPEVEGFISIAPPSQSLRLFLPGALPSSGLIVHGDKDIVAPPKTSTRWSRSSRPRKAS